MKALKILTTSLSAGFEKFVSQVENHEAIVDSAIEETAQAYNKARVQLNRINKDGEQLKNRREETRKQVKLWEQRALSISQTDKEKALQCLLRKKQAEHETKSLEGQVKNHDLLEANLQKDLTAILGKLEELKKRRNEFIARQSCCDAIKAANAQDFGVLRDIDDVFGRWEVRLGAYEINSKAPDDLEEEFNKEEEQTELELELEELIKSRREN